MTHPLNEERCERARRALVGYDSSDDDRAQDLITDLLHIMVEDGKTIEEATRAAEMAVTNFQCEQEPDDIEEGTRALYEQEAQQ